MIFAAHAPALVDYIYLIDSYPERGGHAVVRERGKSPGGAGANVAHHLASLGMRSVLYTTLGEDDDAEYFVSLTSAKVVAEITDSLTGRVHVFVDAGGERTFFVEPNAAGKPYVSVGSGDILYLDPFPSDESFKIQTSVAEKFEGFVILNPGFPYVKLGFDKLRHLLKHVDMLILSSAELNELSVDISEILTLVEYLVVTEGEGGSSCYTAEKSFHSPGFNARVVDTTGAGDAFAAGFIYGFMKKLPLDVCLTLGNFCGAFNVERLGARNFPDKGMIDEFLASVLS